MPRRARQAAPQPSLLEVATKTAPCVPAIRDAVRGWVGGGYKGATPTTKTLLNYWFRADHRLPNGEKFQYYPFQREAIETLIYLYEVARVRRHADMIEAFAKSATAQGGQLRLLQYDDFPRYCLKMATGSGKTKVLSLAVAWQYFNAVLENDAEYAKTSLIIAPNVIVFERLKLDFGGGRIFRADPVIPPELKLYWDIEFVEQLEHDEEIEFDTFDLDEDRVVIEKIFPDPAKVAQDICVPVLSPALARKRTLKEEIEGLDVSRFKTPVLPVKAGDAAALEFRYEGYDIITLEKMIERDYSVPEVQTSQEVISYYAKRIATELKLPSQFAVLAPKDRAAQLWCENASLLTGIPWEYMIVHQKECEKLHPDEFSDLVALEPVLPL